MARAIEYRASRFWETKNELRLKNLDLRLIKKYNFMKSPVKIWRNQKKLVQYIGKQGVVVSYTVIRVPPADFSSVAPYAVAIVDLDDGSRVTAQVADYDLETDITDKRVHVVIRRVAAPNTDGVIPYGMKVRVI